MDCNCRPINPNCKSGVIFCPLHAAAPKLLEALKNEVMQLANMAAMVDPVTTQEYMTSIYAAIATAEPPPPFTGEIKDFKIYPGKLLSPEEIGEEYEKSKEVE